MGNSPSTTINQSTCCGWKKSWTLDGAGPPFLQLHQCGPRFLGPYGAWHQTRPAAGAAQGALRHCLDFFWDVNWGWWEYWWEMMRIRDYPSSILTQINPSKFKRGYIIDNDSHWNASSRMNLPFNTNEGTVRDEDMRLRPEFWFPLSLLINLVHVWIWMDWCHMIQLSARVYCWYLLIGLLVFPSWIPSGHWN